MCLDEALERLWGIEARLGSGPRPRGLIERPHGFRVVEPRISLPQGRGWVWYYVSRVSMDSWRALRLLSRETGARGGGLLGLKDACAYAYQHVALRGGEPRRIVKLGGLRAWLLGEAGAPRLGMHRYNIFRIWVDSPGGATPGLERVPGFYGPQRFGITRPNTHYLGLLFSEGRLGEVLREYRYRYPIEDRRAPGSYELRELSRIGPGMPRPRMLRIMAEALQAYIFNRALSRALSNPREYGEHHVDVECMGRTYRVPASRLPSPRLARGRSRWARLVASILEEEGISWHALRGLSSPFRPLLYPVCGLKSRRSGGRTVLRFALPRGAYATSLLRELYDVDWAWYDRCRPVDAQASKY